MKIPKTDSSLESYAVQVCTGSPTNCQNLVSNAGTAGHTYTFRVWAKDRVDNEKEELSAAYNTSAVTKYYVFSSQRVAMRQGTEVYYLHGDHLGSTSLTTDASLGVDTGKIKLWVYVICAFGTGVTGGLIYLNVLRITPDAAFSVQWTAFMIFIVVIGGIGTVEGPILGTLIFFLIREYLSDFGGWSLILLGLVAVGLMLVAPQGLWGLLQERFRLELFPLRRRLPEKE